MKYYSSQQPVSDKSPVRYYRTWQEALSDFVERFGHNYADSYNLAVEFEQHIKKNSKGVWFLYWRV